MNAPRLGFAPRPLHRGIGQHIRWLERQLDDGTLRGKRMVWDGRAPVRAALYLAARRTYLNDARRARQLQALV